MLKILKYSFWDLLRSKWSYVYLLFYLILGLVLLFLNNDLSKAIITMMNVTVVLIPMISTVFGIMYYYSSREFTELLLAQPLRRSTIFLGQYLGVALSLSSSLVIGLGVPFLFYGLFQSAEILNFIILLINGCFLTFIFTALATCIGLLHADKIKGFGYAILMWLFLAVIYDGLILLTLVLLRDYPLDRMTLVATMLNPIDLSRILILLKLDISALLGYTGALFQKFFGTSLGMFVSLSTLVLWTILPVAFLLKRSYRQDF